MTGAIAFTSAQQYFASIRRIAEAYAVARPRRRRRFLLNSWLQWGGSSAGRASRSQCEGREFDPPPLHQPAISSKVPASPGKTKKPLRINALGLFSCPRRIPEKFREIGVHIAVNFCRSGKIPASGLLGVPAWPALILSTATLKAIKQDDSRGRLRDGDGLYLRLFVNGGSHGWRFDYTFRGQAQHAEPGHLAAPQRHGTLDKGSPARRIDRRLGEAARPCRHLDSQRFDNACKQIDRRRPTVSPRA